MLINGTFRNRLFFTGALMLGACAQIVNPSGGIKDSKPPVVVDVTPANKSTLFKKNKIIIRFDEFIQLNNPEDQIILSPPVATKPVFINKGKTLEVILKDTLKKNTTYTINFGNSIGDNKENNLLSDFSYVFSTGEVIDSNRIIGSLRQAFNNNPEKDVTVGLHYALGFTDTTIQSSKPIYLTKTNETGDFYIENLPQDSFKLIAFKDDNKNLKPDKNEAFAYYPSTIKTVDSVSYLLKSYLPDTYRTGKVIDSFSNELNKLVVVVFKPQKTAFKDIKGKELFVQHIKQSSHIDTFYLYTNYPKDSTVLISLTTNDTSHILPIKNRGVLKQPKFTYTYNKQIELGDSIRFKFNSPLVKYDTSRIRLLKDSLPISYKLIQYSPFELLLCKNWEEKTSYSLIIKDSAFTSLYQESSKSDKHLFVTKSQKDYATLLLHIKLAQPNKHQYIIQLTDAEGKVIHYEYIVRNEQDINLSYVLPNSYKLKIIHDTNNNGIWDNGDYSRQIQPEKISYHPDLITLKAYWDLEQSVLIE